MGIAETPEPPYTAVIFTSLRADGDGGYAQMSQRMEDLAREQPGYLGVESARGDLGITVSYWADAHAARAWKAVAESSRRAAVGTRAMVPRVPGPDRDRRAPVRRQRGD